MRPVRLLNGQTTNSFPCRLPETPFPKFIDFTLRIPETAEDLNSSKHTALYEMAIFVIDSVAKMSLSADGKSKSKKQRQIAEDLLRKDTEKERQEVQIQRPPPRKRD
jgi:hypothetical protein